MKVIKLLKYYSGFVDVAFYIDNKLVAMSSNIELFKDYPLDMNNYFLLNNKVEQYSVDYVEGKTLFQINIKRKDKK